MAFRPAAPRRRLGVLSVLALVAAACGQAVATASPAATRAPDPTPAPSAAAFPLELVDDEGGTVVLPAEPERIVSLTPAATETLFALGVGDRLVGKVEDVFLYPPEAAAVPDVARFGSVDVEAIVGLEPDLVVAGGADFNPDDAVGRLRSLGVPVLVVAAEDVATALADFELIGRAVGRPAEGAALAAEVRAAFDEVAAAVLPLSSRPLVFYELDASNAIYGPAPDSLVAEMIRLAGAEPVTSGTDGVYEIPIERIVAANPSIILLADAAWGVTPEQVAARPGWGGLAAVAAGAIRGVDDVVISRPGPRLAEGIRALALAIRPGLPLAGAAASSAP